MGILARLLIKPDINMTRLSIKNAKASPPAWMTNTTGILVAIIAASITAINTLPGGVPEAVKEWLLWGLNYVSLITAAFAGASVFTKSSDPKNPPTDK